MSQVVRAGLVQSKWAGDKDTMTKNAIRSVQQAAADGAKVVCLQELFNGPYFCQVQEPEWYDWAEPVPDGPTVRQMMDVARENGVVLIVPLYEVEQAGVFYNTAAVIDADGRYLGKHRKNHIPQVSGFWEKYYFRPGNLGYPVFDTAVGRLGVYICYERHFPEGWRALGLAGAKIVFNPSATSRGLSEYLWRLEQPAAAVANEYYVGTINRVGREPLGDDDFYGQSYFVDPRGQMVGEAASDSEEQVIVRDLDLGLIDEVRQLWAFYRDRRPESYGSLCEA
jgi:N-carbamoylputrescine amidase